MVFLSSSDGDCAKAGVGLCDGDIRAKSEGELQIALGTLASDMNLNPGQPIVVPAVGDGVKPDLDFLESVAELMTEAERGHPAIAAARAQLEATIAKEQQTRAQGLGCNWPRRLVGLVFRTCATQKAIERAWVGDIEPRIAPV